MAKDILHNVFADVDVPSEVFNRLLRPATFGYIETKTVHSLCGGDPVFSEKVGEIGAVYVAWVCCFDELCDRSIDALEDIKNCVDEELLLKAMNDELSDENIFLNNLSKDVDLEVRLCIMLWQTYIQKSKKLYESSMRKNVWNEFVDIISTQYAQQIICIGAKTLKFQPEIWEMTQIRSSSPLWVNFLISFLSNDTDPNLYSSELKKSIIELGEVAKIVDDIVDLTDDIFNRKCNYVLIKARQKYPLIFDEIGSRDKDIEIVQWIIDGGVVAESVDNACQSFHRSMDRLDKIGLLNRDFEQYMKMFLSNWFK